MSELDIPIKTLPQLSRFFKDVLDGECAVCRLPIEGQPLDCDCLSPLVIIHLCSDECLKIHIADHDPKLKGLIEDLWNREVQ
jgi:hypothetical protein